MFAQKEKTLKTQCFQGFSLGAGAGFEPTTSGL